MKIISNAVFLEKPVYEDLIQTDVKRPDGSSVHYIDSDLILLFNQERLESLGQTGLIQYLNSIAPRSDVLNELRSQCSDAELLALIKSRHIQSPSDLMIWSKYLDHQLDNTKAELERIRSEKSGETISFESGDTPESKEV